MPQTFQRNDNPIYHLPFFIAACIELLSVPAIIYFEAHGAFWFLIPFLLIDSWNNFRKAFRRMHHVTKVELFEKELTYHLANGKTRTVALADSAHALLVKKYYAKKTVLALHRKVWWGHQLIGRLHLTDWPEVMELFAAMQAHKVKEISYRSEGFWSKYGLHVLIGILFIFSLILTFLGNSFDTDFTNIASSGKKPSELKKEIQWLRQHLEKQKRSNTK